MGRVFLILGIVLGGVTMVGVAIYFALVRPGMNLDAESQKYVDDSVQKIVASWDVKEMHDRASSEFLSAANDEQLNKLFQAFRKLGRLTTYNGSKGQAGIFFNSQTGKTVSAQYVADADFENGKAQMQIYLLKKQDGWKIAGFRVNSPLFLNEMAH